jgi:hypothetical protein
MNTVMFGILDVYTYVYNNNNNSIVFYDLSQQPKDQLWSKHEQEEETNAYTKAKHKTRQAMIFR